jgi:hypothetical protein
MWHLLKEAEKRLSRLEAEVERATLPLTAQGRELVTFVSQDIVFSLPYRIEEKKALFYNGDVDSLILWRIGVNVDIRAEYPDGSSFRSPMLRQAEGFGGISGLDIFDFSWNFLIGSTQSLYSRDYLSSNLVASGQDRSQMYSFSQPVSLPRGDSIEFRVLPTSVAAPPYTADISWIVSFLLLGYRSNV